jgi:hypothetical protein
MNQFESSTKPSKVHFPYPILDVCEVVTRVPPGVHFQTPEDIVKRAVPIILLLY